MAKSLKVNYIYNLLYQITAVLLPLITMPYVSRVLKPEGVGINSYTNANIQYFILLGTLGVGVYASKTIAEVRDNAVDLKNTFWEIFTLQFMGCIASYVIFVFTLGRDEILGVYYFLQSLYIISSAVDISWYFIGIEEFKKASIRSFIVKVSSVVLIFIFVKTQNDLWKYILINSATMVLGQLILWFYVDKSVLSIKSMKKINIFKHLTPVLLLFIPQVSTQIYTVLDKTMTGIFASTMEVAFYDQSQKIIRITLALVTSLGMVMLPRISNLFSKGEEEEAKLLLKDSFRFISFLSIPIAFGIMSVSSRFVPIFFGSGYEKVILLSMISSVMLIIIGVGNVFGTQYLLAVGKTKEYTIAVTVGAAVNFVLNLILIPKIASLGAVLATVSAELIIALIQGYYSRRILSKGFISRTLNYWISGLVMACGVFLVGRITGNDIVILLLQIMIGGISYVGLLFVLKDDLLFQGLEIVKSKINK